MTPSLRLYISLSASSFLFEFPANTANMSLEVLDGATVRDFVEDEKSFNAVIERHFSALDADKDGLLSYGEMVSEIKKIMALETKVGAADEVTEPDKEDLGRVYRSVFSQFDRNGSGAVDLEEFRAEMGEILLAVAKGLGFLPVQMVLEEGSFLKMAVDRESAMIASS